MEEKGGTALKIDVPTRWNSTYTMLKSIDNNYEKVYQVLIDIRMERLASNIDRSKLQLLIKFLEPFYQLTTKFSSQSKETLANVWPTVAGIFGFLNSTSISDALQIESDESAADFMDLETMKISMLTGMTSTVGRRHQRLKVTTIHKIAAMLDPRLKKLSFTNREEKEEIYFEIIKEMQVIAGKSLQSQAFTSSASAAVAATESVFGIDRFYNFGAGSSEPDVQVDAKREFETYKDCNFAIGFDEATIKSDQFPLIFWKDKGNQYPILRLMAKKYLAVPATSVPSEQIFSLAGRVISERRAMLSGKSLEMAVFAKKNLGLW